MPRLLPVLALLFALSVPVAPAFAGELKGHDGWIREAPPVARVRAGYLVLENTGVADLVVTGARSQAFGAIEIHTMVEGEGGAMRMRRLPELVVPAGGRVELRPGGLHLMLFRAQQPLAAGDTVTVELDGVDGPLASVVLEQR
ncbi:MAG: copper chaperone PCu(A)C [Xanthomonadales bacterium]|nr:copper chaperone PCu(A)C [Xanthomonadales bacterium]